MDNELDYDAKKFKKFRLQMTFRKKSIIMIHIL